MCSRCFGIGAQGDLALLPLVDMLNHSAAPHVRLGKAAARDLGKATAATGAAEAAAGAVGADGDAVAAAAAAQRRSSFVAAAGFGGARPGCTFGAGPKGLGYYEDDGGKSAAAAAAAAEGAASEGEGKGSEGVGFTLTLARAAVAGEELFSTYDKVCNA